MSLGITVDFNANIARFSGQLERATQDMSRFTSGIESGATRAKAALIGVGAGLAVERFASFVKSGIDTADALNDMADRTGATVEQLASLQNAIKLADTSNESFQSGLNKLSIFLTKSADDAKALGITAKDPIEAFKQFADVFKAIEDPQRRAAVGAAVLGKSYADLAPLLLQGSKGLEQQMEIGKKLNPVTAEMAAAAGRFNDQLDIMQSRLGGVASYLGGKLILGFEQLIGEIQIANSEVVNFNNTLKGIGNFAFSADATRGLTAGLADINDKIVAQKQKIETLKNEGGIGGLVDGLLGYDVNEERSKLDKLFSERERMIVEHNKKQQALLNKPVVPEAKVNNAAIDKLIGGSDPATKTARHTSALKSHTSAINEAAKAEESRAKSIQDLIESLQLEVDSYQIDAADRQQSLELTNALKDAKGEEATKIIQLVDAKYDLADAEKLEIDRQDQLIENAKELGALKYDVSNLANSNMDSGNFGDMLSRIDEARKLGALSDADAKRMQDELGKGFNESMKIAEQSTGMMSVFAEQAARNMQGAFADFLFDPFAKGSDGMVSAFADSLKRMAANAASAGIMEALLGKLGGAGSSGELGGLLGSLLSGAGSLIGGLTGGGFSGVGPLMSFQNMFANGGVMTSSGALPLHYYASGGIAKSPQMAIFGEGRMNEAYVPLPDGRSIPVSIKGGASGNGGGNVYNVSVNVQSSANDKPDVLGSKIARSFIQQVAREEIKNSTRAGNQLNKINKF